MKGDKYTVKTSKKIIGLPVFSIAEVLNLGIIKNLLFNPDKGTIDFMILEFQNVFPGNKLVPYPDIVGVGDDAVMVKNKDKVVDFSSIPAAQDLLEKNVKIVNSKIITEKGTFVGQVSEMIIDEETGEVTGCQWMPNGEEQPAGYIPAKRVITFGREIIVVDKNFKQYLVDEISDNDLELNTSKSKPKIVTGNTNGDPLKFFEKEQNEYLIGQECTTIITDAAGQVLVNAGDTITPEIIELAIAADKYVELTLNVTEKN